MPWPLPSISASSSAASSTLTRNRITVIAVTSVASVLTAYAAYQFYNSYAYEAGRDALPSTGLHRSNAVHRRRRRNTFPNNENDSSAFVEDQVENDGEGHIVARTLTDGETVIDDQMFQDEYDWANLPQSSYQRNGQNIVQLLFRVSEDATRRNAYVHRGCACNGCGTVPIRGIRYRCANCADYDLCEVCESQGLHIKTHIFYKIKVPAPAFGPRNMQPVWYSGDPDSIMRVLPKEILTKLSRETGFERPELDAYWEQWTFMANTDWRDDPDDINLAMDRKTFERCLVPSGGYRHTAPSLIFDRMFAFYDTNKDDLIGFPEFLHGVAFRKKKDKWKKIFEGYDLDEDGYVDRKDFLRIFRSYYVLHRQLHRDMLEGMEEQQMSSIDAHRLVNSRQPLSSAFGQDGRYPRAPNPRTGEGKVTQTNGDLEIVDGKGVLNESTPDTGNREDIFRRDVPRMGRSHWVHESRINSTGYWETMLNPPETVEQMPDVLQNLQRIQLEETDILPDDTDSNAHPALLAARQIEVRSDSSDESENQFESDQAWPPNFVTDEDAEAIDGPGTRVADVRPDSQREVMSHAIFRQRAHREMYERWQRRQFYTDEEEGATPPADWKEEDDILVANGITGESSKSSSRPIIHSRSSSKVRFAEDMDDFDTRSNPSTSSRSVPERWGGMEIPDAERDAGKEILYQVTQQAFNELLDPLFKEGEDRALKTATTKDDRERYRSLYTAPEFSRYCYVKYANSVSRKRRQAAGENSESFTPDMWPQFPEVELEQVRDRPLEELLEATGYHIDSADINEEAPENASGNPSTSRRESTPEEVLTPTIPPPTSPIEVLSIIEQYDEDVEPSSLTSTPPQNTPSESPIYRDPTLPQFRPNSSRGSSWSEIDAQHIKQSTTSSSSRSNGKLPEVEAKPQPDGEQLYKLWLDDRAAKEAEKRGGWGRLNFKEFEEKVKGFVKEGRGNQMDYLGSWIEFCIP